MGTKARIKPANLAAKLKTIRVALGLTTEEMVMKLNHPFAQLHRATITQFEKGRREPSLPILLKYARIANVYLDVLVDDELNLPDELPCEEKSEGVTIYLK